MRSGREYLRILDKEKELFKREFGIELSEHFDPVRWVRGFNLEPPEIKWTNLSKLMRGSDINEIEIWLLVKSERDENKDYSFRIKYKKTRNGKYFFPYEFDHCCYDIFYWESIGRLLFCKHVYNALLYIDTQLAASLDNVAKSTFIPNDRFRQRANEIVYSREEPTKKVEYLFEEMVDSLTLREAKQLKILNKRLNYLRKV